MSGICCIDEFDKMSPNDQISLYEVMEQQTLSISKSNIITTLNANTSILAAANPVFGRYNRKKSIADNMNLSNALLSRFDIVYLLLDNPNHENDLRLANHIAHVHKYGKPPDLDFEPKSSEFLRSYISLVNQLKL